VPQVALTILKYLFLALIFLFLARAVRAMYLEISGPRTPRAPSAPPAATGRPDKTAATAINDAKENLMRAGRLVYLEWAAGMALTAAMTIAAILMVGGIADVQDRAHVHLVLLATGAGAIGVLLSIAIAIRGRTIVIDGNRQTNIIDAALRVLIGAISAAVLFLLLDSGALADIQIGAAKIAGKSPSWQATLLVGFAAGFFERLVPDLLEKAGPPQGPITTPAPAPAPTSG